MLTTMLITSCSVLADWAVSGGEIDERFLVYYINVIVNN